MENYEDQFAGQVDRTVTNSIKFIFNKAGSFAVHSMNKENNQFKKPQDYLNEIQEVFKQKNGQIDSLAIFKERDIANLLIDSSLLEHMDGFEEIAKKHDLAYSTHINDKGESFFIYNLNDTGKMKDAMTEWTMTLDLKRSGKFVEQEKNPLNKNKGEKIKDIMKKAISELDQTREQRPDKNRQMER